MFVIRLAVEISFRRPHGVIGDNEVEQAIFVVIEPGSADTEHVRWLVLEAGAGGDIGERPVRRTLGADKRSGHRTLERSDREEGRRLGKCSSLIGE
jgi:hypothetical protein